MRLTETLYEDRTDPRDLTRCCTIHVPLAGFGYVNFQYRFDSPPRHAVGINSIVEAVQRSALLRPDVQSLPSHPGVTASGPALVAPAGRDVIRNKRLVALRKQPFLS